MRLLAAFFALALSQGTSATARAQAYVDEPNSLSASITYTYAPSGKLVADSSVDQLPGGFEASQPSMVVLAHLVEFGAQLVTPLDGLAVEAELPLIGIKASESSFMHQPVPGPYDDGDYHWTLTDFRGGLRYQLKPIEEYLGLALVVAGSVPTDYPTMGLAAPGHGLKALYLGTAIARTLDPILPNLFLQVEYEFALREKVDVDPSTEKFGRNYSSFGLATGYFLPANFYVGLGANVRRSHGGLRFERVIYEPEPVLLHHDRLLREDWTLVGGDIGYTFNDRLSLVAAARFFVQGKNTRNQNLFGLTASYRFF